jgi:hypothetical protein
MRRRDISKALLFVSASSTALVETAQGQTCTPPCYAITAPESAAGVTVFQTQYLPGDIRRYYGGESDWTLALNRLSKVWSEGVACTIPTGTYPYSTSPTWFVQGNDPMCGTSGHPLCNLTMQLTGERGAVLQHTGTGPAFDIRGPGGAVRSVVMRISNLIISGNQSTTDGFVTKGVHRSYFHMIEVRNCSGKAFNIQFGIGNHFDNCFFSTNVYASTVLPTQGFCLDNDGNTGNYTTTCTFTRCFVDGLGQNGIGCELANAIGNVFIGCTFEANGIGLNIEDGCDGNRFVSAWFESSVTSDARIKGRSNHFSNCSFQTLALSPNVSVSTGRSTVFEGGYLQQVNLQSTSANTRFVGIADSFATITGTGTSQVF